MSWGKKIAIFYTVFAVSMLSAVIFASMQTLHLVSEDYYQEEIAYEERIQEIKNTQELDALVEIAKVHESTFAFHFPESAHQAIGVIQFYRPSDAELDQAFPIKLADGKQLISVDKLAGGNWQVQIRWAMNGKAYYQEVNLSL
ncbi:MAG: FixH family protein [Bacteroidota bacterium]